MLVLQSLVTRSLVASACVTALLVGSTSGVLASAEPPTMAAVGVQPLVNPDPVNGDRFGRIVAIDGDYAAVGEFRAGPSSVAVYHRIAGTWVLEFRVPPPRGYFSFGNQIQLQDDTLIVSNDRAGEGGELYVYQRTGTAWQLVQTIAGAPGFAVYFGQRIDLDGDRLLVIRGSEWDISFEPSRVFIYERTAGIFTRTAEIGMAFAGYGALSGNTLILSGLSGTRLSHYEYVGGRWKSAPDISVPGPPGQVSFRSFDVAGDVLAVGNPLTNAVQVYERGGNTFLRNQVLAPGPGRGINFGSAVVIDGDQILVGDSSYDSWPGGPTSTGSVTLFSREAGRWSRTAHLTPPDAPVGASFGQAIDLDEDVAIVGAPGELSFFNQPGAAYIVDARP